MKFNRIVASDFDKDGGTHLSFAFGEVKSKPEGPGIASSGGTYITCGFPSGEWTHREVADQLRKLADHLEKSIDKMEKKKEK